LFGRGGDLAATLGASAINAGIAAGSLLGGAVLARHGPSALLVVAVAVSAVMAPAAWGSRFIHPGSPAVAPNELRVLQVKTAGGS
jgi:MFS transporter, DHA1 family, inner membrane transport protein